MSRPAAVGGLFETHLTVRDVDRSVRFYRDVVGLHLGMRARELDAAFFWIGDGHQAMLGLWSAGSAPNSMSLHIAFAASLNDVLDAPDRLRALNVVPLSFQLEETNEPSVIGWMPAAAVYFRDPDGHLLEFLAMLDAAPDPQNRILSWSEWSSRTDQ
jgi:lactoylglutathione lyase